jgi:Transposase DDE domain
MLDPAEQLVALYHERWEVELTIDELKNHQLERPVLRSQTPAGVIQELYAVLLDHYILRVLMHEAAMLSGLPPRQLSFTGTIKILRCRIAECPAKLRDQNRWWHDLPAEIAQEPLPPRRNRINPRVIKRKMSRWKKKRPPHYHHPQPTMPFIESVRILR